MTARQLLILAAAAASALAQPFGPPSQQQTAARNATEKELESIAIVQRKVMVPMRDGKRMAADIYRPKDASRKSPIIFVRTPYNFNYWDVRNGAPRDMSSELQAVKRGYAYVQMNERGHFFSEGVLRGDSTRSFKARSWHGRHRILSCMPVLRPVKFR